MTVPVMDQEDKKADGNTSTIQDSNSLTSLVDDEIILAMIVVFRTASQSAVNSVVKLSGTNTMGSFAKLAEFASADHFISVWWAKQTVKGSFIVRWDLTVGCIASTDYNLKVTQTYTGAKADQTGAAALNTNYAAATANPTAPLTTTAADSMVFSISMDTADQTDPAVGANTNLWWDAPQATNPRCAQFTRYTASTATPGLTTQNYGTYNGTTEFVGQALAWELLATVPAPPAAYIRQAAMGAR